MDCTHPNTGQESQAKAVPSATAEEIQGLTSYPENFYSGAIESVLTQCISVWYNNATNQDCKALQRVVRLAERISGSAPSLSAGHLPQTLQKQNCKKSSRTRITPVTTFSFYCHLAGATGACWLKLKDCGGVSSSGHQAPKLSLMTA